jgi:hypothetical protein
MNALTAEKPNPAVPPMTTILLPASATGATLVFIAAHFHGENRTVKRNQVMGLCCAAEYSMLTGGMRTSIHKPPLPH